MALQNDWIVAGINNPDFTVSDFANFADLTTENTQLLGVDDYIKTDFIQNCPYFKDDAGNFNEDLFRNYYEARAQEFDTFAQDEFYRGPALDMFDLDRTQETPVKDVGFNITRGFNPDRQQIGVEGVNVWSDPKFSQREIAKQNRVFNTERGEFEDWSVDDHVLSKNVVEWFRDLWRDPLVLATWDEDGTHIDPTTGMIQQHVTGQPKLNDKGTYYYETLGDRSVLGKDVLSLFDTFTVDGEGLNRYDFFDSNDLRKSVGGTIMKNVVSLIPMFIPGVSSVYSGVLLARELAKTLPMLSGMVTSLTGGDTPQWAETASAWAQRMTQSMSDEAARKPFAFEHFAGLVADLAMLTGQQKLIAETFGAMRGGQRYIEEATLNARRLYESKALQYGAGEDVWRACLSRFMPQAEKMAVRSGQLGRDLGLAYIALTFQHSTYDEMLQRGASKQEASAVALGAILGMFSVDKWLHLGEIFYNDATGDSVKLARRIAHEQVEKVIGTAKGKEGAFADIFKAGEAGGLKLLKRIREVRDNVSSKFREYADGFRYHTLTATGKMVGSGVERVAETLVSDLSKGMYELAGQFGVPTSIDDAGSFENMAERYGMAFLAGVLGAGVHYGSELVKRGTLQVPKLQESLETLVRNGYADELRAEVDRLERAGRTGSRSVSAESPVYDKEKGEIVGWETRKGDQMSQSEFVAKLMRDNITAIESVLADSGTGLSDDELFKQAVFGERRLMAYRNVADLTDFFNGAAKVYRDYMQAEREFRLADNSLRGNAYEPAEGKDGKSFNGPAKPYDDTNKPERVLTKTELDLRNGRVEEYRRKRDEALERVRSYYSGDAALDFARKLSFSMDPRLVDRMLSMTEEQFCEQLYGGKRIDELTFDERVTLAEKWGEKRKALFKSELDDMWERYKRMERETEPIVSRREKGSSDFYESTREINRLINIYRFSGETLSDHLANEDTWLGEDYETEEEYNHRNEPMEGESKEDYEVRRANRLGNIVIYNQRMEEKALEGLKGELDKMDWKVDPMTKRRIKEFLDGYGRPREIIDRYAKNESEYVRNALGKLSPDLSNVGEVLDGIRAGVLDAEKASVGSQMDSYFESLYNLHVGLVGDTAKDAVENAAARNMEIGEDGKVGIYDYMVNYARDAMGMTPAELLEAFAAYEDGRSDADPLPGIDEESRGLIVDRVRSLVDDVPFGLDPVTKYSIESYVKEEGRINSGWFSKEGGLIDTIASEKASYVINRAQEVISEIEGDKWFEMIGRIRADLRNPAEEMLNDLAKLKGAELPDGVTKMLSDIWNNYDTLGNLAAFALDDVQERQIREVGDMIRELGLFIEAASSEPGVPENSPVGHNKSINAFAERNAGKLSSPWRRLPELSRDLAELYLASFREIEGEIDRWKTISDRMKVDKKAKIKATDPAIARMNVATIMEASRDFEFMGVEHCDLLKGMERLDMQALGGEKAFVVNAEAEEVLVDNVAEIAAAHGMSIPEALEAEDGKLLEALCRGIRGINDQYTTSVSAFMDVNQTPYSKVAYIATILSERPSAYYRDLAKRITESGNRVPIATQEIGGRMAHALMTGNLGRIMSQAHKMMGERGKEMMERVLIVTGAAGVGKTFAIMGALVDMLKGKEVLLVGPSEDVAKRLARSLGMEGEKNARTMTIEQLRTELLGETLAKKIRDELDTPTNPETEQDMTYKAEHFTRMIENGLPYVKLNDEKIRFADRKTSPAAILVDEATNLSTVDALIINKFLRDKGGIGVFAGDFRQMTYSSNKSVVNSIEPSSLFGIRAPELTLSLRDGNAAKADNAAAFNAFLETIMDDYYRLDTDAFKGNWEKYVGMARAIRPLRYAGGEELHGLTMTPELNDALLAKLKRLSESTVKENGEERPVTVAYIGDPNSETWERLQSAGVRVEPANKRDIDSMKGDEFDYVVVDQKEPQISLDAEDAGKRSSYHNPTNLMDIVRQIYTLDTRSRVGTVMIDNGVSKWIGQQRNAERGAMAPSLAEAIAEMKNEKLNLIGEIDLRNADTPLPKSERPDGGSSPSDAATGVRQEIRSVVNDPERPESDKPEHEADAKAVETVVAQDSAVVKDEPDEEELDGGEVPAFSRSGLDNGLIQFESYSLPVYSAEYATKEVQLDDGSRTRWPVWTVSHPKTGTLRNLQCLYGKTTNLVDYEQTSPRDGEDGKINAHRKLAQVRSAALFDHEYEDLPSFMQALVTQENWENRRIALEFRIADDAVSPIGSSRRMMGMMPQKTFSATVPFYANYVLLFEGNDLGSKGATRTMAFDLAGLNNPDTLAENAARLSVSFRDAAEKAATSDDAKRMRDNSAAVVSSSEAYGKWFSDMYGAFSSDGFKDMLFDVDGKARMSMRTWWVRRSNGSLRLDGWIDPASVGSREPVDENTNNFLMRNPDFVVSPVYILMGDDIERLGLSPKVRGRACVFVSSDTLLDRHSLAQEYIDQRQSMIENAAEGKAVQPAAVRMVMLDNYGLTLRQLLDYKFMERLGLGAAEEDEAPAGAGMRKPVRYNYVGFGMFKSLWNARAAVTEFNSRLRGWMDGKGYTSAQVEALCKAYDLYNVNKVVDRQGSARELLEQGGLSTEAKKARTPDGREVDDGFVVFDELTDFNDNVLHDLPMFRLGSYSDVKERNYGFHVQRYRNVDRGWYGSDEANLCAITEGAASRFEAMLNAFLDPLTDKLYGMRRIVRDKDGNIESYEPFGKGEYIDERRQETLDGVRSIAAQLSYDTDAQKTGVVGNVEYNNGNYYTLMARMVRRVVNRTYRIARGDADGGEMKERVQYDRIGKDNEKGTITFDMSPMRPKRLSDGRMEQGGWFADMLEMLFHGTMEDPHRPYGAGVTVDPTTGVAHVAGREKLIRMDDAQFKNGFYIEPGMLLVEGTKSNEKSKLTVTLDDGKGRRTHVMDVVECDTAPCFFGVNVNMRGSALRMDGDALLAIRPGDRETAEAILAKPKAVRKAGEGTGVGKNAENAGNEPADPEVAQSVLEARDGSKEMRSLAARAVKAIGIHDSGVRMAEEYARVMALSSVLGETEGFSRRFEEARDSLSLEVSGLGYEVEAVEGLAGAVMNEDGLGGYEVVSEVHDGTLAPGTIRVRYAFGVGDGEKDVAKPKIAVYENRRRKEAAKPKAAPKPKPTATSGKGTGLVMDLNLPAGAGSFSKALNDVVRDEGFRKSVADWYGSDTAREKTAKRFMATLEGMAATKDRQRFLDMRNDLLGMDAGLNMKLYARLLKLDGGEAVCKRIYEDNLC